MHKYKVNPIVNIRDIAIAIYFLCVYKSKIHMHFFLYQIQLVKEKIHPINFVSEYFSLFNIYMKQ